MKDFKEAARSYNGYTAGYLELSDFDHQAVTVQKHGIYHTSNTMDLSDGIEPMKRYTQLLAKSMVLSLYGYLA